MQTALELDTTPILNLALNRASSPRLHQRGIVSISNELRLRLHQI